MVIFTSKNKEREVFSFSFPINHLQCGEDHHWTTNYTCFCMVFPSSPSALRKRLTRSWAALPDRPPSGAAAGWAESEHATQMLLLLTYREEWKCLFNLSAPKPRGVLCLFHLCLACDSWSPKRIFSRCLKRKANSCMQLIDTWKEPLPSLRKQIHPAAAWEITHAEECNAKSLSGLSICVPKLVPDLDQGYSWKPAKSLNNQQHEERDGGLYSWTF